MNDLFYVLGVPSTSIRTHTEVSTNGGSSFSTDTPTYNTETPTKKSLSTVTSTTTLAYQTTLVDGKLFISYVDSVRSLIQMRFGTQM